LAGEVLSADKFTSQLNTRDENDLSAEDVNELFRSLQQISNNARELLDKAQRLSSKSKLAGLYSVAYMRERLNEEIERAAHYQHPCSFVYVMIGGLDHYESKHGADKLEKSMVSLVETISKHMAQFDRVTRANRGEIAMILPTRSKRKAIEITESVFKSLAELPFVKNSGSEKQGVCFWAGVSENPIDGISGNEIYKQAINRAKRAHGVNKNSIEAFNEGGHNE